jgi:AraC family transcriptional regulator, positive regulator of tynA and feaB
MDPPGTELISVAFDSDDPRKLNLLLSGSSFIRTKGGNDGTPHFAMKRYGFGNILVARFEANKVFWTRSAEQITCSPVDHVGLIFVADGTCSFEFNGQNYEGATGAVALYNLCETSDGDYDGVEGYQLVVPRGLLGWSDKIATSLCPRVIPPSNVMSILLGRHARALFAVASKITIEDARRLGEATAHLIDAATFGLRTTDNLPRRHAKPNALTAIAYIEQNLSDPKLTVKKISEALATSKSALYREFGDNEGIASYILRRRVQRACISLTGARPRAGLLASVAREVGFISTAALSRAFRARLGISPTTFLLQKHAPSKVASANEFGLMHDLLVTLLGSRA